MSDTGLHIEIRGTVQGVGFRPWVYRMARAKGLRGFVRNDTAGVTIEAFGPAATLDAFRQRLRRAPPPPARVRDVRSEWIAARAMRDFVIAPSLGASERRVSIPADLATCGDCEREIFDPDDRRHQHPFANCTSCGPRFTIATESPYDRARTTMASFEPCAACGREYSDPLDRRFHAEPIACPACGPRLELLGGDGRPLPSKHPLRAAARALARTPGDKAIAFRPTYQQLPGNALNAGIEVKTVALREERGWALDLEELEEKAGDDTKLIHVVNPNNPTGHILEEAEVAGILAVAPDAAQRDELAEAGVYALVGAHATLVVVGVVVLEPVALEKLAGLLAIEPPRCHVALVVRVEVLVDATRREPWARV